jgi:signal transduction histidine kinase/ligand-binding sensor domain-containing protein
MLVLAAPAMPGADSTSHQRTIQRGHYRVTYWTSEQGLPQNTVDCTLQSRDGYLWIGTRYGLARYDGVQFTDFTSQLIQTDEADLDVRDLEEDTRGRLWISTRTQLACYYDGEFHRYTMENAPLRGPIQRICPSRKGGIWVAREDGVFHFLDGKVGSCLKMGRELARYFGTTNTEVGGLIEDAQGNLWVRENSVPRSMWQRFDMATRTTQLMTNLNGHVLTEVGAVLPQASGTVWLATAGELLSLTDGHLTRYDATEAWGDARVRNMSEDARGNIWISSEGRAPLHQFTDKQLLPASKSEPLLENEDVRCLTPDREGNLWVGTGNRGLYRLQPWQLVSLLGTAGATFDEVYSIAAGREGRVWLGTTRGLAEVKAGQLTTYSAGGNAEVRDSKRIRAVFEKRSGEVYCSQDFDGLQTLQDRVLQPVDCFKPLPGERRVITTFFEDANGTLWMGSQQGLIEQGKTACRVWTTADGLSDDRTFGIVSAPDGGLWVGTKSGGLNEFRDGRFRVYTVRDGLLSQDVWPLRAERDGSIWVGTPLGLNRIRGGEIRSVTMQQGLFDNLAYCLLEDRRGNYWTFGNRGIWRVSKDELYAVAEGRASRVHCVSYGEADGMVSAEGNGDEQPNATLLSNGEIWFPTTRGVVIVDPEHLRENQVRPPVVIEEVLADGKTIYRDGGYPAVAGVERVPGRPLRLRPGLAKVLELRYTANTFIDSDKTRFRYRLEGSGSPWHEADTRRVAFYTNLRPGDYRFQVEARNHHGYASQAPAEFAFSLAPHFYQTWLFFGVCGALLVAGLGAWHLSRLRASRRVEQLKQEHALEEERGRIAKDLHDDLGANLTGIGLQIEVARRQLDYPPAVQEHLQSAAQSVREMVDRMREVVWSLNPECDTLDSFCGYLCQYAENYLGSAGLRCRLDFPEDVPDQALSAEARHHLLCVVKEGIHNAARHARAKEVRLTLRLTRTGLVLTLADDGCGFAPPRPETSEETPSRTRGRRADLAARLKSGHGLDNMRYRVEALGGTFGLQTQPGMGTSIIIRVPFPGTA